MCMWIYVGNNGNSADALNCTINSRKSQSLILWHRQSIPHAIMNSHTPENYNSVKRREREREIEEADRDGMREMKKIDEER